MALLGLCVGSGLGESNYWYVDQNRYLCFFSFFLFIWTIKQLITSIDKTSEIGMNKIFFSFDKMTHFQIPYLNTVFSTVDATQRERTLTFDFYHINLIFNYQKYTKQCCNSRFLLFHWLTFIFDLVVVFYYFFFFFFFWKVLLFIHSQMREFDLV